LTITYIQIGVAAVKNAARWWSTDTGGGGPTSGTTYVPKASPYYTLFPRVIPGQRASLPKE